MQINSIYRAEDDPFRPKSHNTGRNVHTGDRGGTGLLMVQGPLMLNWHSRKWGLWPRIENGELSYDCPARHDRAALWVRAAVHIRGAGNHVFVKLHTHGCQESNRKYLLSGGGLERLFGIMEGMYNDEKNFCLHYVSAREMVNVILALADGMGSCYVAQMKDHAYVKR